MNAEHPSTERLQRSHDGELSTREESEVHAHIATCGECKAYVAQLARLGRLVTVATEDAGASVPQVDFDRMFANISSAIASDRESASEERAAPVRDASVKTARKAAESRWFQRSAPALGAVALAAAALLMVFRQDTIPGDPSETSNYDATVTTGHSEIVAVDFGSNAGQVFDIPMSDGSNIPVVWIDDDDDEEE